MLISKFGLTLTLSALIVITACSKPEKQDSRDGDANSTATFRIDSGKAFGTADSVLSGDTWQKPLSATFTFQVCIKDRARTTELRNQPFVVSDPINHRSLPAVTTNGAGCMTWSEPIPFNYFVKRSRWVTLVRDIGGTGVNLGKRRVTFGVNPWLAADRAEMKPTQTAYFLRDEPIDVDNVKDRVDRVMEFLKTLNHASETEVSDEEKMLVAEWQQMLGDGNGATSKLVAPVERSNQVLSGRDGGNAEVWVPSISVLSLKTQNIAVDDSQPDAERGYLIQQTLVMKPRLRIQQANGTEVYEDIVKGDFDVYIAVVATSVGFEHQDQKLILSESLSRVNSKDPAHPTSPQGMGRVIDGELMAFVDFKINKRVAEGNVDFVVKLVPRGISNRSPVPFEGVFNMGKVNSWVGGVSGGTIDRSCVPGIGSATGCTFEGYLAHTANFAELKKRHEATDAEPYEFSNIKARFVQIDTGSVTADESGALKVMTGETATNRTVLYSASSCVTDTTGERLAHQKFIIHYLDASDSAGNTKDIPVVTDDSGCLIWTNTISHSYYQPEKFFRQVIAIEGPGGAKRIKTVYINPWDDKFTFGFDEEELGKEFFDRIARRPRILSRFYMGDYSYHTVRFLYEIDSFMDLEVKKTVLMELQPQVLRYSNIISGRKVTEPLRDGIYLMKVAIQKSYLDPSDRFRKLCEADRARSVTDHDGNVIEHWEHAVVDNPEVCALSRDKRKMSLDDQQELSQQQRLNSSLNKFEDNVVAKDFITTKATLVRVTDGLIIQPVELSMKDLRLMRIRSNFLIELETVDERKVLFNDQLNQQYQKLIAETLLERRQKQEEFRAKSADLPTDQEVETERKAADDLALKVAGDRREYFRSLYTNELSRLDQAGNIVDDFNRQAPDLNKLLERFDGIQDPVTELHDSDPKVEADNRRLYERYQLYRKMAQNDFTKIAPPDCDRINCEAFREEKSFLEPRTFVGPVIFLSNAYSDAMRATDNLDETKCHEQIEGVDYDAVTLDPVEIQLLKWETSLLVTRSEQLMSKQTNNAYRYNKYFNSLRQFCVREVPGARPGDKPKTEFYPKQVDDLMREEQALKISYDVRMKALATPFNFASIYNLEFFSFGGEKLRKIDDAKVQAGCLSQGADSCMVDTVERAVVSERLLEMTNRDVNEREWYAKTDGAALPWTTLSNKTSFNLTDLKDVVFGDGKSGDAQVSACSVMSSLIGDNYKAQLGGTPSELKLLENIVFRECIARGKDGVYRDRKLRIYGTGDYVFMGGMQLNFNVGSSFGVDHSTSASAGIDFLDSGKQLVGPVGLALAGGTVGGPAGALVGGGIGLAISALKPFDFTRSSSMGSSSGTSVSEGTYLVGQVAKFSIPLTEWEQCNVLRLHPKTVQAIASLFDQSFFRMPFLDQPLSTATGDGKAIYNRVLGPGVNQLTPQVSDKLNQLFGRGLFLCEGIHRTKDIGLDGKEKTGKDIEELYFYFTQHFTEGDMLDQADLYNHPWLLSLRGLRDFSAFVNLIQGHEVVSTRAFFDGLVSSEPKEVEDTAGWPLQKLADTYKATLPSFPGLYTVLDDQESMDYFPLKSKHFSKRDMDLNAEVNRAVDANATGTAQE